MQIICVSRAVFSGGEMLSKTLAKKLRYACLSREQLITAAQGEGINVGKLEMSMLKPSIFTERMARWREHYLAFCQAYLCERAGQEPIVYHGRTGHMLLPGIGHVLKVRVVAEKEQRVAEAMRSLNLERKKAARYIEQVDEDSRSWARAMYAVSWEDVGHYDMVMNLEQMGIDNAASALVEVAQLPSFRMTPASEKALADLYLGARARLALARDERTRPAGFKVRGDGGVVTVTYLPQDARYAEAAAEVIRRVDGVTDVHTTMATTNVLWIQERYDPDSETYQNVVEVATKWNAAVELMRLSPSGQPLFPYPGESETEATAIGGIEDDAQEPLGDVGGMRLTMNELARVGCSGGGKMVSGGINDIVKKVNRSTPYSLVVIGDVFLEKGHAVRQRLARELQGALGERLRAPVVGPEQLKARYLFGKGDAGRLLGYLALVAVIYLLVFSHQEAVASFLVRPGWHARALAVLAVFALAPVVAYLYGTAARSVMKLIKMD